MKAIEANTLAKSKTPFLEEILRGIERQAERGLFQSQVNWNLITDETVSKLKELGYDISKGGVDNVNYIIDWKFINK